MTHYFESKYFPNLETSDQPSRGRPSHPTPNQMSGSFDGNRWSQTQNTDGSMSRPPTKCYTCGKIGHKSTDCYSKPYNAYRPRGGRGGPRRDQQNWRKKPNPKLGQDKKYPKVGTNTRPSTTTFAGHFPQLIHYYLNERLSDMSFIMDGQTLVGHKFVVSAKSPVFRQMLYESSVDCQPVTNEEMNTKPAFKAAIKSIDLMDTNVDAFKVLLKFIYLEALADDIATDRQMVCEVLKLSVRYKVQRLTDLIETKIVDESDNWKQLAECLLAMIETNSDQLQDLVPVEELKNSQNDLKKTAIEAIVESNPQLKSEEFKQTIKWDELSINEVVLMKNIGLIDGQEFVDILGNK